MSAVQGMYQFYLQGPKKEVQSFLQAFGTKVNGVQEIQTIRDIRKSYRDVWAPANLDQAGDSDEVHIVFEEGDSGNVNGMQELAKELHAQIPAVEMLYLEVILNNEAYGSFVYGAPGNGDCKESDTVKNGIFHPINYEEGTIEMRWDGQKEILHFDPNAPDVESAIWNALGDWCTRSRYSPFRFSFYVGDDLFEASDTWDIEGREPYAHLMNKGKLIRIW